VRKKGDLLFNKTVGSNFDCIVADVTISHPCRGAMTSATNRYGSWSDDVLEVRYREKRGKYDQAYTSLRCLFVPLVASTYGVLHSEFLRLLWVLSDVTLDPSSSAPLQIGEVRHGKPGRALSRHGLFAKLRARVCSAIAFASAGRILGVGIAGPRAMPKCFPSDCVFCVCPGECYVPPPSVFAGDFASL
jgi:hypothetical protein